MADQPDRGKVEALEAETAELREQVNARDQKIEILEAENRARRKRTCGTRRSRRYMDRWPPVTTQPASRRYGNKVWARWPSWPTRSMR